MKKSNKEFHREIQKFQIDQSVKNKISCYIEENLKNLEIIIDKIIFFMLLGENSWKKVNDFKRNK